jgi:two-component system phosphate regulon sensor histidine kinase PhoR
MLAEQRAFASNASHELRTPLTTIRLRTEPLLAGEVDPATAHRYLTEIHQEVIRMAGLVDDLILLSRLDAHRLAVGEEEVDTVRLVRRLQQEVAPLAAAKGITVQMATPVTPLPPIQTNLNHAHVVMRNLLDNALKYTPTGGQVVVTMTQQETMLQLAVADTGQGIAAADLPNITKRFFRADKAHQRQTDGTGLGLALVQSIVDLYGGRIMIHSAGLNQGTTVTIWWPLQQPERMASSTPDVNAPLVYQS